MSKIIVLTMGYSKSGKDFFSDFLKENEGFKKYTISSLLKRECSEKYDIPVEYLETQEGKETVYSLKNGLSKSGRDILISEAKKKRLINPEYYINHIKQNIEKDKNDKIVVSDVRFKNEIECLKTIQGYKIISVKIDRFKESGVKHFSETQLDDFSADYTIENKRDINNYIKNIKNFIVKTNFFFI